MAPENQLNAQNAVPKSILVLTSTFPRWDGDVEPPFVYELCRRLSESFVVHVLAPHAPGAALEDRLGRIHVTRYRYFFSNWETLAYTGGILANLKQNPWRYGLVPFFMVAQLFALLRLLARCRFDCIHAHWLIPQGLIAIIVCLLKKSAPPVIVTSHGGDLFGLKGAVFSLVKRFVARRSTAVSVVSSAMREVLLEMGIADDKVKVIPMGVDLQNRFVPPASRPDGRTLLFVGRIVEKKGLEYLIEALPLVLKTHPKVVLKIVGDGQEKEIIRQRISALELETHVEFLGAVVNEAIAEIYQASDVVIFPSIVAVDGDREGFGLVLVEALGCECAAIVTDLPAMRDIIQNGASALVVPQKDACALAEKINILIADDQLRRSLGKQGRQYVLRRFDWDIITSRYRELVNSVMS